MFPGKGKRAAGVIGTHGSFRGARNKKTARRRSDAGVRVTRAQGNRAGYAPASPHGVGGGTAHGPSTSIDLKSAGPTISRYSMSGE